MGGKIGVGSHGEFQGLGYHWELWSIASGGMPIHDALRAATLVGAQSLGLDGDLGSLAAGPLHPSGRRTACLQRFLRNGIPAHVGG